MVESVNLNDQLSLEFDGATYDRDRDGDRLGRQLAAVRQLMLDGQWRTLYEIAEHFGEPEASISARLRDLRKPKFGCYQVEREYVKRGVWKYRVLP